jgi:hypothetical protein
LIQEFQHSLESKWIQVMKMKMIPIQFVSNEDLIQIQSTEVTDVLFQCQTGQLDDTNSKWQSSSESRHTEF